MRGIRKRMEKAELKKAEQQVAAMDAAARQEQVNQIAAILQADAKNKVREAIAKARVVTDANPDRVMVGSALVAYTHFLISQGVLPAEFVNGEVARVALKVIPRGAVEGKAEAEEKRVITLK